MTASPEREMIRMYCRPLGSDITEDYIQHLKQAYLLTKTSACALQCTCVSVSVRDVFVSEWLRHSDFNIKKIVIVSKQRQID